MGSVENAAHVCVYEEREESAYLQTHVYEERKARTSRHRGTALLECAARVHMCEDREEETAGVGWHSPLPPSNCMGSGLH